MNDLTTRFQKKKNSNISQNESEIKGKPITKLPSTSGIDDSHRSEGIVKSNTVKVKDCNATDNLSYVSATEKSCKRPDVSSIYGVPEHLSSNHGPEKPHATTGGLSSNSHGPEKPHTTTGVLSSNSHGPEKPHTNAGVLSSNSHGPEKPHTTTGVLSSNSHGPEKPHTTTGVLSSNSHGPEKPHTTTGVLSSNSHGPEKPHTTTWVLSSNSHSPEKPHTTARVLSSNSHGPEKPHTTTGGLSSNSHGPEKPHTTAGVLTSNSHGPEKPHTTAGVLSSNSHGPEKPHTTTGILSSNSHGPENPHTITRGISSSTHEPDHPHKRTRLSDHSCESMPNVTRPNGTFKSTMQLSVKICVQKHSKNIIEGMFRDRCARRTLTRRQVKCFKPKADDKHNGSNFEHVQHTTTPANGLETTLRTLSDNSPANGLETTLRTLSDNSPANGLETTLRTLSDNSPANGLEPTLRTLSDNSPANGLETTLRTLSDNSPANGLEPTLRTLSDNSPANGLETTLRTLSDNSPANGLETTLRTLSDNSPANGLEPTLRTLSDNSPANGLETTLRTLSDNSPANGLETTLRTLSDNSPANGLEPTLRTLSDNSPANGLEPTLRTLSDNSPANSLENTLRTVSGNSPANGLETSLRALPDNSAADSRVEDILLKPVENIHSHYLGTTESVGMTGKMNCSGSPNAHYDNVKNHNNSLSKLFFISDKCAGVDICTFTSMLNSEEINPCQSNVPKLNSDIPSTKLHSTVLEGMSEHITDIPPSAEGERGGNGLLASFGTNKGRAVLKNKGKLFGKDLTDKSISTKLSTTADNRNGADCTSTDDTTHALAVAVGKRRNNMPTSNPTNNLQPIEFDESFNSVENECNKCILFPLERQSKPRTNLSEQASNGMLKEVIGQTKKSGPENDLKVQGLSSVHTLAAINDMTEEDVDISLRLDEAQPGKDESSNSSSGRLSTLNSNKMQQTDSDERDSVVGNSLPAMGSNTSTKEIKQPVDNFLNSSITDPVALNGRLRNSSTSYDERSGLRGKHIKSSDKRLNDVANAYPSYIKPSNDETNVSPSFVRLHDDVKSIPTTQESTDHNPDDHRPPTSSEMTSNELINERFQPAEVHVHTHSASHNGSHISAYFPNLAQEPNSQTHSQGDPNPRDIANRSNHRRLATSDIASGWTDSIHHSLLSSQPLSSTNMNNHSMSLRVRHSVHLNEQTSHIRANVNEEYVIDLSKGQIDPEVTRDLPPVLNEENVQDEILQIHGASNIQLVENSSAEDRQLEPLLALNHNQSAFTHTWSTIMSYYPWGTNYGHVVFPERDGCCRCSNAVNTILFNCHCKVLCALCARQASDCPECGDSVLYFTVF